MQKKKKKKKIPLLQKMKKKINGPSGGKNFFLKPNREKI